MSKKKKGGNKAPTIDGVLNLVTALVNLIAALLLFSKSLSS